MELMDHAVHLVAFLQPYAELATPLRFELLHDQVDVLSSSLGLASDQLRYVLCLFAAYPLAQLYNLLPSATLKHLVNIVLGVSMAQFVLGAQWVHSFLSALTTYVLVRFGPAKYAPYVVFAFNMLYMSASHIYRLYVDYMGWTLDFTGPQMLLVIKLTSFAYNYYDGVVDKTYSTSRAKLSPGLLRVYEARQKFALRQLPSPLEFFGYVYSFTAFFAGPAFEIREYLDVTSGAKFLFKGKSRRPSSSAPAFSKFVTGASIMAAFAVYSPQFPLVNLYGPGVAALPALAQLKTIWVTLLFCKAKYYAAWKIAEGATVLCGFGFEGFTADGETKGWNGVSNMDILGFELAQSFRESSRAWNKGTQNWLERYVYTRTGNSLVATYFVSAIWHGFYAGYYIFFLSIPLATSVNRLAYKRIRPHFFEKDGSAGTKKKLYDLLSFAFAHLGMHYFVMPFQVMSWEHSVAALRNVHFLGHIVCVALYVVFSLVPAPKPVSKVQ